MTTLPLNSEAGPVRPRLLLIAVALLLCGTVSAAIGGAWVGTQIGESRALSELAGLCERMPDIALDNPSMCLHIETMLPGGQ